MVRRLRRMPVFDDFREPTGFGNYSFKIGTAAIPNGVKLSLAFAAHGYDVPAPVILE